MKSDSVLWQKPYHGILKKSRDNTKAQPRTSITQRLRTDSERSVWVPTVVIAIDFTHLIEKMYPFF